MTRHEDAIGSGVETGRGCPRPDRQVFGNMKKILVVHYSQSGQLTDIVHSILSPLEESAEVEMVEAVLRPEPPYPFPWTALEFADAFPEALREVPCRLAPADFDPAAHYDLIILAYQVWYLSPSIPVSAFLQSAASARVLAGRPVVTIIGCRNMWLLAHEKVKARIVRNGGIPAGNIVLMDRAPNLLGVVSIAYWMLTGKKERFLKIFPKPGVAGEEIRAARRFGCLLLSALRGADLTLLQPDLNRAGAVTVVPAYILFEQRIARVFKVWAEFVRRKGGPGDPARRPRLRLFIAYLLAAVFLLAPLAAGVAFVLQRLKGEKIKSLAAYFAGNHYKEPGGSPPPDTLRAS